MNTTQEKEVIVLTVEKYEAFTKDVTELMDEVHALAVPVLQAVSHYKEISEGEVEKEALQCNLLKKLDAFDIHGVLDAIEGIEVMKQSLEHLISLQVKA